MCNGFKHILISNGCKGKNQENSESQHTSKSFHKNTVCMNLRYFVKFISLFSEMLLDKAHRTFLYKGIFMCGTFVKI